MECALNKYTLLLLLLLLLVVVVVVVLSISIITSVGLDLNDYPQYDNKLWMKLLQRKPNKWWLILVCITCITICECKVHSHFKYQFDWTRLTSQTVLKLQREWHFLINQYLSPSRNYIPRIYSIDCSPFSKISEKYLISWHVRLMSEISHSYFHLKCTG